MVSNSRPIHPSSYLGIFILCLGLLCFELFFVRILAFVGGAHSIYLTIAFAMLGLAAASSAVSLVSSKSQLLESSRALPRLCVLTAWAVLFALCSAWFVKGVINERELAAIQQGGFLQLVAESSSISFISISVLGGAASVVYFLFGTTLSILFRRAHEGEFGRLYAFDLLGACLGCVVSVLAMELLSYTWSALLCVCVPMAAAVLFALESMSSNVRVLLGNTVLLIVASWAVSGSCLEPTPLIERLARDYAGTKTSEQDWRVWNSYGRISGITTTDASGLTRQFVVHGNGEGHAAVADANLTPTNTIRLATTGIEAKRILVLMAGVGYDMAMIDQDLNGEAEIVGVELVGDVFQQPFDRDLGITRELFERENVTMVRAEAREFLARDTSQYDLILLSWSGASLSYHSGAASSAADFIYTKEALVELLSHLTPEGQLLLLNGNKIRLIFALKEIFAEQEFPHSFEESVLVTNSRDGKNLGAWWRPWDNQRLMVRPSGFTVEDVDSVSALQHVLYGPHHINDTNDWYVRAILEDTDALASEFVQSKAVDLSVVTDDRPFILDAFPVGYYFSSLFWEGQTGDPSWELKKRHLQFVGIFSISAVVLIIVPMVFCRERSKLPIQGKVAFLSYFFGIGAGFMFFEIALISKLQMLIGHPGYVIAIVLGSIIFFTGLGSLSVNSYLKRFGVKTKGLALSIVGSMVLCFLLFEYTRGVIVGFPFSVKCLTAFLLPCVPCFLMGHMFPIGIRLLSKFDHHLTPWALAVNGVSGTLASGMTLILAQGFGYNAMVMLGCLFYLMTSCALSRYEEA